MQPTTISAVDGSRVLAPNVILVTDAAAGQPARRARSGMSRPRCNPPG